jgi:predicted transcriptional regulator
MEQSEIRVFSFLLQYANGTKFSVNKPIRLEISKQTELNERTVYNTIKKLEDKKLIFKHDTGAFQVNPRYAFKGSSLERNNQLKLIIELGCKEC